MQGYHLTLVAQDSSVTEPRATAVNLTITVLDENDNAPHFSSESYTVQVPDRTQPGTCNPYTSECFMSVAQHFGFSDCYWYIKLSPLGLP